MTELDLFESIGNVNDQAVEMAQKPLRSRRRLIIEISSLAACAVFACAAVMLLGNMNQNNSALVSGDGSGIVPAAICAIILNVALKKDPETPAKGSA